MGDGRCACWEGLITAAAQDIGFPYYTTRSECHSISALRIRRDGAGWPTDPRGDEHGEA